MSVRSQRERGAVSIFIVIFTALLITVITVSFVRLMVRDQDQSMRMDLSQSAYDSAQAGIEDAKRALLRWQDACVDNSPECGQLESIIRDGQCNTVARILHGRASTDMSETQVQQTSSSADATLDQAYTCTVISTETDNYEGQLGPDESRFIRLRGTDSFDRIQLSWFMERDLSNSNTVSLDNEITLPNVWDEDRPPIMRAQLIRAAGNFFLEDFNDNEGSSTLYLYPNRTGLSTGFDFVTDSRMGSKQVDRVGCSTSLTSSVYFCSAEIMIPGGVDPGDDAFLRLVSHYNDTHYEIRLLQGSTLVQFDGVQPLVDSTGRANDMMRRVESRIELMDATYPYPEAAVDIQGDFCKTFLVTDEESDFQDGGCTP